MTEYRHVWTDEDIQSLVERNSARLKEAQNKLGHLWVMADTRLPKPAVNVTKIAEAKKVAK